MLSISLFGTGHLYYQQRSLLGFPNQQPTLVLCYLLLNRERPHNRETLAGLLWPDGSREASLKALRNSLWRLRQMFQSIGASEERYLVANEDRISFNAIDPLWLDIEAFEQGVQHTKGQSAAALSVEQAETLEKTVALYKGDLLEGVYQDWCLVERERLRTLYLNARSRLMTFHEAHSNYEQGLAHGEAVLLKERTREVVHRKMMRLYWLSGNRSAALAQYHQCARVLQEDLGVKPMAQTQHLYESLCHHRAVKATAKQVPTDQPEHALASDHCCVAKPPQTPVQDLIQRVQRLQSNLVQASHELEQLQALLNGMNAKT